MPKDKLSDNNVLKLIKQADDIDRQALYGENTAYMARLLIFCTLPYKEPTDASGRLIKDVYHTNNGIYYLAIQSGTHNKNNKHFGIPYGSLPRLLLSFITSEATRKKERKIYLGDSLSDFMRTLDVPITGDYKGGVKSGNRGGISRLKDQMNRLFTSRVSVQKYSTIPNIDGFAGKSFEVAKEQELWWEKKTHPSQTSLFKSSITLTEQFFNEITSKPVPVHFGVLRALKASPLALDYYMFLTYRMSYLEKTTAIPWKSLQKQFGSSYSDSREFTRRSKIVLKRIKLFYKDLNIDEAKGRLILHPSPTHIPKR